MTLMLGERERTSRTVELSTWLEKAEIARKFAEIVADSAFCPMSYKLGQGGRLLPRETVVANCTSAILLGDSLGVDPLTSLQNIFVINGKPGLYTNFKVALLQSHSYEIHTVVRDPKVCTVRGWKSGPVQREDGSPNVTEVTIRFQDAEQAGWTSNPQYRKVPADMLYARAAGRLCDMLGADVLHGLATAEDLEDYDEPVGRILNSSLSTGGSERAAVEGMAVAAAGNTTTGGSKIRSLIEKHSDQLDDHEGMLGRHHDRMSGVEKRVDHLDEEHPSPNENLQAAGQRAREIVESDDLNTLVSKSVARRRTIQEAEQADGGIYDGGKVGAIDWTDAAEGIAGPDGLKVEEYRDPADPGTWVDRDDGPPAALEDYKEATVTLVEGNEGLAWSPPEEATMTDSTWESILSLFNKAHQINGDGKIAARQRVIIHVIGRHIDNRKELTEEEGLRVYSFLRAKPPGEIQRIAWEEA